MTPAEYAQRIRQIELQLIIADYGMGMPRDYQRVLYLRQLLEQAKQAAREFELERLLSDREEEGQDKPVKEQMIGHPMSAKTRQALDQIIGSWKKEGRR